MNDKWRLPAEWEPQSAIQLTWPHQKTDWAPYLDEITETYLKLVRAIAPYEQVIIAAQEPETVKRLVGNIPNVSIYACQNDDTWARDHAFITLVDDNGSARLLDFRFNGWGEKFPADKDNTINRSLYEQGVFNGEYEDHNDFVLEGGSIESDGKGTIYTTRCCLMAPHRNQPLTEQQIEEELKRRLHAEHIVWLDDEALPGDDTDGHIDTLARILPDGSLLRLPLPDPIIEDGEQLPATYANYLIINGAVIVPTYGQPRNDQMACEKIQQAFPDRKIIPIDARTIIRQHGSIHCLTMQYPEGIVKNKK